jgi:aldose 1-epimerase
MSPNLHAKLFGLSPKGDEVILFTLSIPGKVEISIMNYGATWTHLMLPDRTGKMEDVVLGFDDFKGYLQEDYLNHYCYLGSTIGRVAGRIRNNEFKLGDKSYKLPGNQGEIHLHGGMEGWDKKVWKPEPFETDDSAGITFYYRSEDGEENYPGKIDIWVTYTLDRTGKLEISYTAITDKKTIINPTNHAYFNLSGDFSKSIEDHSFFVNADHYLPMDQNSLPTGDVSHVAGTAFDFRRPEIISQRINENHEQMVIANGIDHFFVLNESEPVAQLIHPGSGRTLTLSTNQPGVQVYTGNYLNGEFKGKNGIAYPKRSAICLETQHHPDACNHDHFPSVLLLPGEVFQSRTIFEFSVIL